MSVPAAESLSYAETVIRIDGDLDNLGRCRFTAWWRDDSAPNGLRGQRFHAELRKFVRNDSKPVRGWDEYTRNLLSATGGAS